MVTLLIVMTKTVTSSKKSGAHNGNDNDLTPNE